ncbi:MAG: GGDEF domain-containing protein [bacterium]|nr:GGDEF domain-containing protein [bacterium]
MRALEDYNKETVKNLTLLVSTCMRNLWICYVAIITGWMIFAIAGGDYQNGMFVKHYLLAVSLTGILWFVFWKVIAKRAVVLSPAVSYLVLNAYIIILLAHPSGLMIIDALLFGVIAVFPVWNNRLWVKIQLVVFAVIVLIRQAFIELIGIPQIHYMKYMNFYAVLCVGVLVFFCVQYVHTQTMVLGNAVKKDATTGLYNHEYFYEELENRMETFAGLSTKEREEGKFSLLIADIDNFKSVNDTYGHAFGDIVLIELASIVQGYCGAKDFSARYGGEEFAMILGDCNLKDALTRANTVRKKFERTVFKDTDGEEHQFTVSIGVAEYNREWNTASQFFDQADQALYKAKATGKNRVCSQ